MLGILFDILMWPIERLLYRISSRDHRDDPVYKKNLKDLIERNQKTEKQTD